MEVRSMAIRDLPRDDGLAAWIADLRARLDRGDLAKLPPVDIGHGTHILPLGHTVQIMLADLDSFDDMSLDEINDPVTVARRYGLLSDFRLLRLLIG
jgi:hypothetical protein